MGILRWFAVNGSFALLVYFATVLDNESAANWVFWLTAVLTSTGTIGLWTRVSEVLAAKQDWPTTPQWLDFTYDLVIITMMVTYGMMWTATIYAIHTLFLCILHLRVAEIRRKATPEVAEG